MSNLITSDFDEPILYAPARVGQDRPCNSLNIITAFTDCERISTHAIKLREEMEERKIGQDLQVTIIVGMTKTSLSPKKHSDICRLIRFLNDSQGGPRMSCRYLCNGPEIHSKVYVWGHCDAETSSETPLLAYCGSLNYTSNAFYRRREAVVACDPVSAYAYFSDIFMDTVDCSDPSAIAKLKQVANNPQDGIDEGPSDSATDYAKYDRQKPIDAITVSLLQADGRETGYGSGVNWGIRQNGTRRNQNQAYIPYNQNDKKDGFFPDRINPSDKNCPMFRVITKDFGSFHMRMAQAGNKALHSVESNAILGEWIRTKIGVVSGGFITKQLLERYGKTCVTFRKYADGTYLLDF